MRIVSWNVNGIRAAAKKGFVEFMETKKPDILGIQESKAHPDQVPPELHTPAGTQSYWSSAVRRGYSGTVTFVKKPVVSVQHGIGIKKFDSEGRFVVTDHGDFLLYNVYFPNGDSGPERHEYKQEFLKKFATHLKKKMAEGREIVLMGDYNVAHTEIDLFDPVKYANDSGFLPEERAWFSEFLQAGFVDCFRHLHPNEKGRYTWWSYREFARPVNRGWRIDYICVSRGLLPRVKACEIWDDIEGSDHCPVMLELK